MNAINYEVDRQTKQFEVDRIEKNSTNKTTRGWDADHSRTFLQREKEGSADYRYFPEPDIPPIIFSQDQIEAIRATLPELPDAKIAKYKSYQLSEYDANLLAEDVVFSTVFEKAVGNDPSPEYAKFVANQLNGTIRTYLNESQTVVDLSKVNPSHFKDLFDHKSELSSTSINQLVLGSYQNGSDPLTTAKSNNLFQVSDIGKIEELAKQVIEANPKAVADYQKNPLSIGFLVGQLMRLSQGSANPQLSKEILEKLLK
jgi:aspartyl-tRNA(Asn)/glutamyl-tRNA(Gln) amidotransferase subunit B